MITASLLIALSVGDWGGDWCESAPDAYLTPSVDINCEVYDLQCYIDCLAQWTSCANDARATACADSTANDQALADALNAARQAYYDALTVAAATRRRAYTDCDKDYERYSAEWSACITAANDAYNVAYQGARDARISAGDTAAAAHDAEDLRIYEQYVDDMAACDWIFAQCVETCCDDQLPGKVAGLAIR